MPAKPSSQLNNFGGGGLIWHSIFHNPPRLWGWRILGIIVFFGLVSAKQEGKNTVGGFAKVVISTVATVIIMLVLSLPLGIVAGWFMPPCQLMVDNVGTNNIKCHFEFPKWDVEIPPNTHYVCHVFTDVKLTVSGENATSSAKYALDIPYAVLGRACVLNLGQRNTYSVRKVGYR